MASLAEKRKALGNLSEFIKMMTKDGVVAKKDFSEWAKKNRLKLEELFMYEQVNGMPAIYSLVKPFFHPDLPLIGLNYTPVAHNTLHAFHNGWTLPLRLCRGIIFDSEGNLVALPFMKFFNYLEHPETMELPDGNYFEATVKMDGHLGIIFEYKGKIHITTRGSFIHNSSNIGKMLIEKYSRNKSWEDFSKNLTLLTEIIHPTTRVYTEYQEEKLVLIGASDRKTFDDIFYEDLLSIGKKLNLPVTEIWTGKSLKELVRLMKDKSVQNQEGFVVRTTGLRFKLKFDTYIAKMVADKLSFKYLMNRFKSGNLKRMIDTLPEEIYNSALEMLGRMLLAVADTESDKEKHKNLYELLPPDQQTPYAKGVCREFVKVLKDK